MQWSYMPHFDAVNQDLWVCQHVVLCMCHKPSAHTSSSLQNSLCAHSTAAMLGPRHPRMLQCSHVPVFCRACSGCGPPWWGLGSRCASMSRCCACRQLPAMLPAGPWCSARRASGEALHGWQHLPWSAAAACLHTLCTAVCCCHLMRGAPSAAGSSRNVAVHGSCALLWRC